MVAQYHINAVPAFVVQHSFKTDLQMAKTEDRLFAILDYLSKKSAKSFAKN
jgi:thiol:disulfide interchange protein DsbA